MPTYEYECNECGHRFDVFQKMSDDPVRTCEKCSGRVRRLIGGGAGIIFKGSGFYVNDYKNGGSRKNAPAAESTPKSDTDSCSTCSSKEACSA